MRILFVTCFYKPAYVYGGSLRSISMLCEALTRLGAQVSVCTTNANGPNRVLDVSTDRPVVVDGVEVSYFPVAQHAIPIRYYSPGLGRACRDRAGDFDAMIISSFMTYPAFAGSRSALKAGIPFFYIPHGMLMHQSFRQKWLKKILYFELIERRLINKASAIIYTSELEMVQAKRFHLKPPSFSIPHPIDFEWMEDTRGAGEFRKKMGIRDKCVVSVFIGRIHRQKNIGFMVEVFLEVAGACKDAHLVIVGFEEDESLRQAKDLVSRKGLSGNVHFAGSSEDIPLRQVYSDADMFVSLSKSESFGMSIAEAMACGLPVLIGDNIGIAKDVSDYEAGMVVPLDKRKVAEAWLKMISEPDLRRRMGENGKRLVRERFSSAAVAPKMIDLLSSVINKRNAKP